MRLSAFTQLMIRESQERAVVPENIFRLQYVLYVRTGTNTCVENVRFKG